VSALQVKVRIDRRSPVPLYHQLAEQLTHAINVGQLKPGDPFENEVAVANRLHVSRPTVRRAIQELVDQGLLVRRRGLGTTVANSKVHRKIKVTSLYDDLLHDGRQPLTTVRKREMRTNERVATALDLPTDIPLLCLVRVRLDGETPLALMRNWLPPAFSDLTGGDLENHGLYALLRERGIRPVVAQQSIGARMPTALERRYLMIRGSQPVLTMTRMAFDGSGRSIEYGEHSHRALDYTIDLMVAER
jgi:GntR family transcriptional regulator